MSYRLYYHLKPYLPWRLRMALRRIVARRKRQTHKAVWPINPTAARPPESWPGWPDGKKFAFVITHDVEGPAGLANCRKLMELDKRLGFRSSFNFTPEGNYAVSSELRRELVENGFEVGIHDLHHDGRLYSSRENFSRNARQINHYLKKWGAVGFRPGFMLRNLEWLHELDIRYDSSTFDTDPFEPQPDGVGAIFPFWVPTASAPNGEGQRGYIELPYTLPQDSTLFLLLRESSPEIWFRKLDWIAQNGGMASLNVHPDYLQFSNDPPSSRTYPADLYITLLRHVRDRFHGLYWQPLPREVAEFAAPFRPRHDLRRPRRICMVTHSFYESDGRVLRYAEALARRGDEVEVFALRQSPELPKTALVNGVRLVRLQDRFGKNERSQSSFLLPLLRFLVVASAWLTLRHARRRYDLVHVHNLPDFLVFAAWLPRLTGSKIILDIHDIVPELYASKFGGDASPASVRALQIIERLSAAFASHVIMSNHLWLEKYAARTHSARKCSVFINNVNADVFYPRPRRRADGKTILLFPGGLQWHQGLDIAIRAFPKIRAVIPNAELNIYGEGNMKESLIALAAELGLQNCVRFSPPMGLREIAAVMANADLGIVPKRADSFGNEAYSTKIMEFMSLGVPVVVSSTKIDRFYFNDSVARFFASGNSDAFAQAVIEVLDNDSLRRGMISNALDYAAQNSWTRRKSDYLDLVDSLIENQPVHLDRGQAGPPPAEPASLETRIEPARQTAPLALE
ncbi:MAG: glycosyltransferase [Verrucomicrobiota bacterium]|nr:glycosyltransferase [Verrucomicrobiota bacterium]